MCAKLKNKKGQPKGSLKGKWLKMLNVFLRVSFKTVAGKLKLNGYFKKSFSREEDTNRLEGIFNTQKVLAMVELGDKEVLGKLHKLKTNKTAGPDGILPKVLKVISEIIFISLASIFRQSLETGEMTGNKVK